MYKILIADDEMIVRHAVKSMIRWEESRFEYAGSAANGRTALELARGEKADIVITDIKMPEMDGIELIKQLIADGFEGEVLVLSNYNDFDLVREALKYGAHDYMLKLTLKSESFMLALEEIAVKLDSRRGESAAMTGPAGSPTASAGRIRERLKTLDEAAQLEPAAEAETREGEAWPQGGERVCAFLVRMREEDAAQARIEESFAAKLGDLADSLFPGARWAHAVRASDGRFVLAASYPAAQATPDTEEVARRIHSLCAMYYNVQVCVVYAEPAADPGALLGEIRSNRRAEGLFFYAQSGPRELSNRMQPSEEDTAFKQAEAVLRECIRKPQTGAIDLWAEGALRLIETAAERHVRAQVLKRSLGSFILSLAHAEGLGIRRDWDEAPWLGRVSAAESDAQLKVIVRELSEEAAEQAARHPGYASAREEVRRSLLYLDTHYSERFTIADVAAHVGLSEPYLCQVFKAETGRSLLTHLNEIRMLKAYDLLATGRYLVKQAAAEVGIHDPFYFNRLFKRRFGIAPKSVKAT